MLRIASPPALSERSPILFSAFLATLRAIGCFLRWVGLNRAAAACLPVSKGECSFPFSEARLRRLSLPRALLWLRDGASLLPREGELLLLEGELPLLARALPAAGEDERPWRAGAADPEPPELEAFARVLPCEADEPPLPLAEAPRFWLPAEAALPRFDPVLPLALFPPAPFPDAGLPAVPRLDEALLDFGWVEPLPLLELDLPVADVELPLPEVERLPLPEVERFLPVERPPSDVERPLLDAGRPLLDPDRD
jgi:hypothetical protein